MTALCLQDPKLCKLAEFRGHGASFYSQIIRQFLTVMVKSLEPFIFA